MHRRQACPEISSQFQEQQKRYPFTSMFLIHLYTLNRYSVRCHTCLCEMCIAPVHACRFTTIYLLKWSHISSPGGGMKDALEGEGGWKSFKWKVERRSSVKGLARNDMLWDIYGWEKPNYTDRGLLLAATQSHLLLQTLISSFEHTGLSRTQLKSTLGFCADQPLMTVA